MHAAFTKEEHAAIGSDQGADAILLRHQPDIERLIEASRLARCDFGVDRSQGMTARIPQLSTLRGLARALAADVNRLVKAGDSDGAAKRAAAILRLSAHLGQSDAVVIELLTAIAISQLGVDRVVKNPSLSQAPSRTEIREALGHVSRGGYLNSRATIRNDGLMVVRTLRDPNVSSATLAEFGLQEWARASPAEREAAARKLETLYAEADVAWDQPGAVSKLAALGERARSEGVGELFGMLDKARIAVDDLRAAVGRAHAAVR